MLINVLMIANTILYYAFEEGIVVTPMKLNKLVWLWATQYYEMTEGRYQLFSEKYAIWRTGPVYASVQWGWGSYGKKPIKKFVRDAKGNVTILDVEGDTELAKAFQIIWEEYKDYTGAELVRITKVLLQNILGKDEE